MKGIAVPYIIAILLGVAVIGLVGYWLFAGSTKIAKSECEVAQRSWCTQWSTVDSSLTDAKKPGQPTTFPTGCTPVTKTICTNLG